MTSALTPTRPRVRTVVVGTLFLLVAAGLAAAARARGPEAEPLIVAAGVLAVAVAGVAHIVLAYGEHSYKYIGTGGLWGLGTAAAGLFPHVQVGALPLPHLSIAVGMTGALLVTVHLMLNARTGSDGPPLVVDALMLGSALATASWDGFARAGHSGPAGWVAGTVLILVVASLLVCSAVALAVEHPRLRTASMGMSLFGLGSALTAMSFPQSPGTAAVAAFVALAGGCTGLVLMPRDGVVQHGGESAARAARRLEIASLVPGPVLLVDITVNVVAPRGDPVMFAFYVTVLVAFTVRHAATARAIDRTTSKLRFQALHDSLTGLANRTALQAALTQPDHEQSIVLLEIAGLDDVNDVLGVSTGDAVIRAAAAAVGEVVTTLEGTAFRTGGDEFAVLLPTGPLEALRHSEELVAAIAAAPGRVPHAARFPLSAIAGIAACPVDAAPRSDGPADGQGPDVMTPFVQADIALRDARHLGAGSVSVYSGAVAAEHARRSLLRERLAAAIRDGLIDVHYQPVVSFTTGRVEKFEALARWDDPVLGRISPVEFIAVAEESNLVVALGEHVLRTAVHRSHEAGVFTVGVGLAVNVSVVQLQSPGFSDIVREILDHYRIAPQLLTLELTESVFLDEDSPAERVVTELAGLGCRIAIDDFGTGYSAFGYLGRLPVHVLKIDRSLTQSMADDLNGQSVVTCVVDLATRLGLQVVVEGVETEQQAAICRFINAPLGQGWLYSAAVPRERLGEQLATVYPVAPLVVDDVDAAF